MGVLNELGFGVGDARGLLIEPPDAVLAEAGTIKPRPTIVGSVMTARPAVLVAWWPERGRFDAEAVSRLHWMVKNASGSAWLVFGGDDEDDALAGGEIRDVIAGSAFTAGEERRLASGETALRIAP